MTTFLLLFYINESITDSVNISLALLPVRWMPSNLEEDFLPKSFTLSSSVLQGTVHPTPSFLLTGDMATAWVITELL